jgi:hypothetical protein
MNFRRSDSSIFLLTALSAGAQPVGIHWESGAQFRRLPHRATPGSIAFDDNGITFRSPQLTRHWSYQDIQTFDLTGNRELLIEDYENRHWHEPGERKFRFVLALPMPPEVAASLAARVGRPVLNGDPIPKAAAMAELPAHRRERVGGSNGTLRFREDGIDYVATDVRASRTWRWSDIQSIANPSPWEFRVTGYREVAEFDLKKPLSRELLDRVWNILYAADLNLAPGKDGHR